MKFEESNHCKSRAHCVPCITNLQWRRSVGAPDRCPHGIDLGKALELKDKIEAGIKFNRTHPENAPRISGCCDSAARGMGGD